MPLRAERGAGGGAKGGYLYECVNDQLKYTGLFLSKITTKQNLVETYTFTAHHGVREETSARKIVSRKLFRRRKSIC